jgi:hypothetical protein
MPLRSRRHPPACPWSAEGAHVVALRMLAHRIARLPSDGGKQVSLYAEFVVQVLLVPPQLPLPAFR